MARFEKLRGYQEELIAPGLKGYNYIICAPTGSGKTLAAACLCHRRMLETEGRGEKPFKAIFIVPTRHLKSQQRDAFWEVFHTSRGDATAAAITKTQQFRKNFDRRETKVLMVTAQILVNALRSGRLRFREVSMLLFDECHHTTLGHPYNEIMKEYMWAKKQGINDDEKRKGGWLVGLPFCGLPQIVGLTASLGTGGASNAVRHIVNLCANLDCSGVKTVTEMTNIRELEAINNLPERDEIVTTPPRDPCQHSAKFVEILRGIMFLIEKRQNLVEHSQTRCGNPLHPYGSLEYLTWIGPLVSEARQGGNHESYAVASYLLKLNLALIAYEDIPAKYVLHAFKKFVQQTKEEFDATSGGKSCWEKYKENALELDRVAQQEDPLSIPKLKCLVQSLRTMFAHEPNSRGILLARTRFTTAALLDFIQSNLVGDSSSIRPTRIVGQGKEIDDAQSKTRQEEALDHFRSGVANLLIATDIVQEGLDVPACNFVIRYNFVSNEIGSVQSTGRARARNSKCFLIVEQGSMNHIREKKNRQRVRDMAEAIAEINRMGKKDWLGLVAEKQLLMLSKIESERTRPSSSPGETITTTKTSATSTISMTSTTRTTPSTTSVKPTLTNRHRSVVCEWCKAWNFPSSEPNGDNFTMGQEEGIHGNQEFAAALLDISMMQQGADPQSFVCYACGHQISSASPPPPAWTDNNLV